MARKELDVGLIKDLEVCRKAYVEMDNELSLTTENQNRITKLLDEFYNEYSKYKRGGRYVEYFATVEDYKGKLLFRVFAIRAKIDLRKKNPLSLKTMEIFRSLEGLYYGYCYSTYTWISMGWAIKTVFDDEKVPERRWWSYDSREKSAHTWKLRPFDYLNGFIWSKYLLFNEDDVLSIKPELKYSQYNKTSCNPIYYVNYYKTYPEIEFLKKCDFRRLLESKRCLNRLHKGDKSFMKFLYKCYQLDLVSAPYETYLGYYKKFKGQVEKDTFIIYSDAMVLKSMLNLNSYQRATIESKGIEFKGIDHYALQTYLAKNKVRFDYYLDYLEMAMKCGHDINDPYWRYPNNIVKAHNKVMEEIQHVRTTESKLKYDLLHEVVVDLMKFNANVDGYDIFITDDIDVIKKQCDELYQCLITKDYVNHVIMQEEILVFIWKDGKPLATAQVFYNKSVGQFYGNERGHRYGDNCKPSKEVEEAFYKWLETFKPVKRKYAVKKKFYKGFCKKTDDGIFIGFGNYQFKIGEVYKTEFNDETIIRAGGKGCNASNKVFHFCDSIEEISKHYNPSFYCEVEPLGPILEHNGALLSNKIKIIRELPNIDLVKKVG